MTVTAIDDRGHVVQLPGPARRVVSLVPSITETVFALGAGAALVGVTRYCTYPADARRVRALGGPRDPDCRSVVEAQPALVLMSTEENRREDLRTLEDAGLAVYVSSPNRAVDVTSAVRRWGALLGCEGAAERLGAVVTAAIRKVREVAARCGRRPRVFCPLWKEPWIVANGDTYVGDVLSVCGADNVCADLPERYGQVFLEEVAARQPELVLLADEPYPFGPGDVPALRPLMSPVGPVREVKFVDGRALAWYGFRTVEGLPLVQAALGVRGS